MRSPAVVMGAVCGLASSCWNIQDRPGERRCLDGSTCWSKTSTYFSACPTTPFHQRCRLLNCALMTSRMAPLLFTLQDTESTASKKNHILILFEWALVQRRRQGFWFCMVLKITSLQYWPRALSHVYRGFSTLFESFNDIMCCRWRDIQSLYVEEHFFRRSFCHRLVNLCLFLLLRDSVSLKWDWPVAS